MSCEGVSINEVNWPSEVPDEYRERWSNYQEVGLGLWAIEWYLNDQVRRCLSEGVADARELDDANDGYDVNTVAELLLAGGKDTLRVLIGNLYPVSIPTEGGEIIGGLLDLDPETKQKIIDAGDKC